MSKSNKKDQLGMDPGTASNRLVKDILWDFICKSGRDNCCKCCFRMSRETFSIEHLTPWLNSEDPVRKYFDIDNISFSHLKCNVADRRKVEARCGTRSQYTKGCRCTECKAAQAKDYRDRYTPEQRKERYLRTGS